MLITRPGMLTTIQASPRTGSRHLGVPSCGPADSLSMALANRLVGNSPFASALEVTLTGVDMTFAAEAWFAVTGASSRSTFNGQEIPFHKTVRAVADDRLQIGPATAGARVYIGFAGGLAADEFLESASTYVPAGLGGYQGRALQQGDRLSLAESRDPPALLETPPEFRPLTAGPWAVRASTGAEFDALDAIGQATLFDTNFVISPRNDRMGLQLWGGKFDVSSAGFLASVPLFPGCLQCPEDGSPYLLGVDAQTTGGYPRIAQVARVDRHIIGQLRSGDHLRLLRRTPEEAGTELKEKLDYWRRWLPDIASVI
ncbi:MAG: biotin-dependent carboxyltransferase family protein [Proteobacteria bacterium]|nr:biotin-dependent carboxyltransferase family protein [Pseudomonadota bacterium]